MTDEYPGVSTWGDQVPCFPLSKLADQLGHLSEELRKEVNRRMQAGHGPQPLEPEREDPDKLAKYNALVSNQYDVLKAYQALSKHRRLT